MKTTEQTSPRYAKNLQPGDYVGKVRVEKIQHFMGTPAHGGTLVPCVRIWWSAGYANSLAANAKVAAPDPR